MDQIKPSNLVHGANIISRYLRHCFIPFGSAYQFESTSPSRPKPLPILVVLSSVTPLIGVAALIMISSKLIPDGEKSPEIKAMTESVFIMRLSKVVTLYRIVLIISMISITLAQHSCISNVFASANNYLSEGEQSCYARTTFAFFFMNVLLSSIAYPTILIHLTRDPRYGQPPQFYLALIILFPLILWLRLAECTTLIYSCYLGALLGRHVENFSTIYIDSMFDQFMKAIEKEGDENSLNWLSDQMRSLPFFASDNEEEEEEENQKLGAGETSAQQLEGTKSGRRSGLCLGIWRHSISTANFVYKLIRSIVIRLSLRRYPELPEMKMTKLSSTTKIQLSESTRTANNHLIRVRLRRTQIMLSDLRDLVNDINKTSSPTLLLHLIFDTMFIVVITTASVQAKIYKSLSILILPTISVTISLISFVVYVCVCYDETAKQLKLLINKLFDFIIMNHRVQSSSKQTADQRKRSQILVDHEQVCILPGSEVGAINETWSQFQYTRKLANTIQFTMGGVMPVTRRLVLSILGHILSAVFISIEIMSIVDTMNMGPSSGHAAAPHSNSSSSFHVLNATFAKSHHANYNNRHHLGHGHLAVRMAGGVEL